MSKILITGATGNIGQETIIGLNEIGSKHQVVTASHRPEKAKEFFSKGNVSEYRKLDFTDPATFTDALTDIDIVFLLRPPNLADVPKYFEPFIDEMLNQNIKNIAFLSVQGVENQKSIPHHKIEKLILDKGLEYIFLRPSYFMQNLTTTLIEEIRNKNLIFIPAGNLKFTWVDAKDIGLVGAYLLDKFDQFKNNSYEITGNEQMDFGEVADVLSEVTGRKIKYKSPSLLNFLLRKRRQGVPFMMVMVMIMLHYLPRFSKNKSNITNTVKEITGRTPNGIKAFIEREKTKFNPMHYDKDKGIT